MLTVMAPWGLLALAGIPAVIALHLFRRRHRPRPVSALFLWGADARSGGAGRIRQPLRRRLSLWCELLAVIALAWVLADVRVATAQAGRHLVLVADARWRMQAAADPARGSAWEQVRAAAAQRLRDLGDGDAATVIASGRTPRLLAGPGADPAAAAAALEQLIPAAADHDLGEALALAARLGGPGAEVVLLSDRPPAQPPPGLGWILRGAPAPTMGLADAVRLADPAGERVLARVVAGGAPGGRPWRIAAGERVIAEGAVQAAPGEPALLAVRLPPDAPETVQLALLGPDPLAVDDACLLPRPPARTLRVRIDLPPGGAIRQAVAAALAAAGGMAPATGEADLAIVGADDTDPAGWRLILAGGDGPVHLGPFLARAGHPLLEGIDAAGLVWAGSAEAPAPGALPLLSAAGRVLIGERRRDRDGRRERDILLHVDWARSQLARHPAWPALIANLLALRRAALPGPERTAVRLGEPLAVQLPPGADALRLTAPDGIAVDLRADADGRVVVPALDRAGAWRLGAGAAAWTVQAAMLDARLADLAEAAAGDRAPAPPQRAAERPAAPPWSRLLPLMLAGAALAAAWWAQRREQLSGGSGGSAGGAFRGRAAPGQTRTWDGAAGPSGAAGTPRSGEVLWKDAGGAAGGGR